MVPSRTALISGNASFGIWFCFHLCRLVLKHRETKKPLGFPRPCRWNQVMRMTLLASCKTLLRNLVCLIDSRFLLVYLREWFVGSHYFRSTQRTKWNQGKTKAKQSALHTRCMTVLQSLTDLWRKKMKTTEWKKQRWWRKWNGWEAWKEGTLLSAGHWELLVLLRLFSRI